MYLIVEGAKGGRPRGVAGGRTWGRAPKVQPRPPWGSLLLELFGNREKLLFETDEGNSQHRPVRLKLV